MSAVPPGAKPTTRCTGRVGYACARAKREMAVTAAAPAANLRNPRRGSSLITSLHEHERPPQRGGWVKLMLISCISFACRWQIAAFHLQNVGTCRWQLGQIHYTN